jgi:hypothetical protein
MVASPRSTILKHRVLQARKVGAQEARKREEEFKLQARRGDNFSIPAPRAAASLVHYLLLPGRVTSPRSTTLKHRVLQARRAKQEEMQRSKLTAAGDRSLPLQPAPPTRKLS